jgi:hypothetical protein
MVFAAVHESKNGTTLKSSTLQRASPLTEVQKTRGPLDCDAVSDPGCAKTLKGRERRGIAFFANESRLRWQENSCHFAGGFQEHRSKGPTRRSVFAQPRPATDLARLGTCDAAIALAPGFAI